MRRDISSSCMRTRCILREILHEIMTPTPLVLLDASELRDPVTPPPSDDTYRRAGPACIAEDPRRRRREPELRGCESEVAEVFDRLAVDRAEKGTHVDVVSVEVHAIALLFFPLSASALWEGQFEARTFNDGQSDKHGRVGRNRAGTLGQGVLKSRKGQEPHGAGLAVVSAVAIKAGFDERMSFDGPRQRPFPPL